MTEAPEKIRCDACPVMCYIAPGQTGACDRYANDDGRIVRTDPVVMLSHAVEAGGRVVPFAAARLGRRAGARPMPSSPASARARPTPTTSPRPSSSPPTVDGADMVTVVTEAIFSYCGVKVKIDTDRFLGPEGAVVRVERRGGRPCHHRRIRQPDAVARAACIT